MRKLRVRSWVGVVLCGAAVAAPAAAGAAELGFDDRVAAQWAIEQVYWRHRIWPDANPAPKPEIHEILSEETVRAKVEDGLLRSEALDKIWGLRLSSEDLRSEVDRMTSASRAPGVLRELFAALGDDPDLIAECLARPALADRLVRQLYSRDVALHAAVRRAAERALERLRDPSDLEGTGGQWSETVWVREDDRRAAAERTDLRARTRRVDGEAWRALETRLAEEVPTNLQEVDDRFFAEIVVERADGQLRVATVSWWKRPFDEWWAEARAAIESNVALDGGSQPSRTGMDPTVESSGLAPEAFCTPDTWTLIVPGGGPSQRSLHAAVWTGAEFIVWGGWNGSVELATGGRYNPATDTWTPTTADGAPSARDSHTAVWTGQRMVVWGGVNDAFVPQNTGSRYDPVADRWFTMSRATGVPTGRVLHTAVWTGSRMVVWGGLDPATNSQNTGGRYDPVGDTWESTSTTGAPAARDSHTAVWIGGRMVVWGGLVNSTTPLATGGRYDPAANSWQATSTTGAPSARGYHTAVAAGTRMIVWGGWDGTADRNTGGRYDPAANNWSSTSTTGAPSARELHTAVWTGAEMVVWGGRDNVVEGLDSGGRYDPALNSWAATSTLGALAPRRSQVAAWAISEMLLWGGFGPAGYFGDGRAYCTGACSATLPTGSASFTLTKEAGGSRLSWTALAEVVSYDLVRGSLGTLRSSSGNFTTATNLCAANDKPALSHLDPSVPSLSSGFWYLVRGINCAGTSSYDGPLDRQSGLRDAEIAASAAACP